MRIIDILAYIFISASLLFVIILCYLIKEYFRKNK